MDHYNPDTGYALNAYATAHAASILTSLYAWPPQFSRDNMTQLSPYWLNTVPLSWRSFVLLSAPVSDLLDLAVGGQLSSVCGREPEVPDGWRYI